MKIGINASFARKPSTGIGQVTVNFLKKLTEFPISKSQFPNKFQIQNSKLQKHEFFIYLEDDLPEEIKLPKNFKKRVFLPLWKRDDLIRKIWWEKYLLPKKIKEDNIDIFFSLYQCPTIVQSRGEASTKHIILAHDIIPKLFPEYLNDSRKKIYWNLTERAIKKADKIIANSRRTEKDLIHHLGIDPAKITVNYLDVDELYKKNAQAHRDASVLKKYKLKPGYIYNGGGLEVRKNTEGVIRAYKYLLDRNNPPAGGLHFIKKMPPLVISGKLMPQLAPLATDAEKLVKKLNLTQYVKLLDFAPQEDLPALYKNAIMFVYPSRYEGFGIPVLEAMNQGAPVVTAKTSSLPEVGGDAVLYCNPDDHKDIAMVMKNIMLNKDLRDTLSRRGLERARTFSWEKFTEKVLNIANEIFSGKNK